MNKVRLVFFITVFISFLVFLNTLGFTNIVKGGLPENVESSPLEKEVCVISGLDAPIDAVKCAYSNLGYLTDILFFDTKVQALNYILGIPLGITLIYIFILVLRGGG